MSTEIKLFALHEHYRDEFILGGEVLDRVFAALERKKLENLSDKFSSAFKEKHTSNPENDLRVLINEFSACVSFIGERLSKKWCSSFHEYTDSRMTALIRFRAMQEGLNYLHGVYEEIEGLPSYALAEPRYIFLNSCPNQELQ